jgi:hypothetical protein
MSIAKFLALLLLPAFGAAVPASAQEEKATKPLVIARFSGALALPSNKEAAQSIEVSLGRLLLQGGPRLEAPAMGYYVATLVAGEMTTSIGGKDTLRHPGDTWAVEAGQVMTVQLHDKSKSALLQIFSIKEPSTASER